MARRPNKRLRVWASDDEYDAGLEYPPGTTAPWAGAFTKVEAADAIAAQGIIPAARFPGDYLNHELNRLGQRAIYLDAFDVVNFGVPRDIDTGGDFKPIQCCYVANDPKSGNFVMIGKNPTTTAPLLLRSKSGYGWRADGTAPGTETNFASIASDGASTFVVIGSISGNDRKVWTYANGAWSSGSPFTLPVAGTALQAYYDPYAGRFLISIDTGSDPKLVTATPGNAAADSWSAPTLAAATTRTMNLLCAGGPADERICLAMLTSFFGVGDHTEWFYSTDGNHTTWTKAGVSLDHKNARGLAWSEEAGLFMVVFEDGSVMTSPDGQGFTDMVGTGLGGDYTPILHTLYSMGSAWVVFCLDADDNNSCPFVSLDNGDTWTRLPCLYDDVSPPAANTVVRAQMLEDYRPLVLSWDGNVVGAQVWGMRSRP